MPTLCKIETTKILTIVKDDLTLSFSAGESNAIEIFFEVNL
jgi:hypothetical protein